MNDFGPTSPHEAPSSLAKVIAAPEPSVAGSSSAGAAPASPPAFSPNWPILVLTPNHARWPEVRRLLAKGRTGRVAAAALMCVAIGLPFSLAISTSATAAQLVAAGTSGAGAANARSAPASGGASGTVGGVFKSSFAMPTSAGEKVTVDEKSSTEYERGTSSTSAAAIKKGQSVLVLGTVNSTTITATQVVVGYKAASSVGSTAKVVPFEKGEATTSKQVGQIPANWSVGSGTIVSEITANEATEAALAAYPGGIVDRVAKLGSGEYNVHYIGVNWPHHVFESSGFKVVGAL